MASFRRISTVGKKYRSPQEYTEIYKNEYAGKIKNVGYPTQDGEPYYLIYSGKNYAIFNESSNKEGAWAFLEFLLSETNQDWYADSYYGFPVRKDAFDEYLIKPYSMNEDIKDSKVTEKAINDINKMMENGYSAGNINLGEVGNIIWEELLAFLADAKTAEETTEIIQNRVQLYLDEM